MTVEDWSQLALIGAVAASIVAIFADLINRRSVARALYWTSAYIGVTCLALSAVPRGWPATVGLTALGIAVAVGHAYFATPFLKIGGRIYAAQVRHGRADPIDGAAPDLSAPKESETYDGRTSAVTAWWLVATSSCLLAVGLVATRWMPELFVVVAFGAALAAFLGHEDGSRGFPPARGHLLPFRIAAVATVACAGIPLWCYLYAYRRGAGKPGYGKHDAVRQRRRRRD